MMYLYLGGETLVLEKNIIGIFDLDTATVSKHTRNYLKKKEKTKKVVNVTYELPKSFIIEEKNNEIKVYISQISSNTLSKRKKEQMKNK